MSMAGGFNIHDERSQGGRNEVLRELKRFESVLTSAHSVVDTKPPNVGHNPKYVGNSRDRHKKVQMDAFSDKKPVPFDDFSEVRPFLLLHQPPPPPSLLLLLLSSLFFFLFFSFLLPPSSLSPPPPPPPRSTHARTPTHNTHKDKSQTENTLSHSHTSLIGRYLFLSICKPHIYMCMNVYTYVIRPFLPPLLQQKQTMSSEEDDIDTSINQQATQRHAGNAFSAFLDSDSSDDDSDSDDSDAGAASEEEVNGEAAVVPKIEAFRIAPTADDDESLASSSDDGTQEDTISVFEDLVGRTTRHGTTLQTDYVEAVQRSGGFSKPTGIQCECWTTMLSPLTRDRDVVAISKTGSGKTLAFLVPLLAGMAKTNTTATTMPQPPLPPPQQTSPPLVHPRAVVLAPTRVLAQQIYEVASALVKDTPSLKEMRVASALGGAAYHRQMADLLAQDPDVLIATPGRLNSLCGHVGKEEDTGSDKDAAMCIKLDNVCELVIDEADMMLALGFQNDLDWFAQQLHKDVTSFRLVLTSATWGSDTSRASRSLSSNDPILLGGGGTSTEVTKNVTQIVEVLAHKGAPRFNHLVKLLTAAQASSADCRTIVFCLHKAQARQMGKDLRTKANLNTVVLEGDMSHSARVAAVQSFRDGTQDVLVATDVAARGLDVLGVTHVFNYSLGISIESYVHRCGRTGRAGRFGVAHTFVTGGDERLTPELCGVLGKTGQKIPDDLRILAGKELKRRSAVDQNNKGPMTLKSKEDLADAEDLRELREANREKQRQQNQNRSKKKNKGGSGSSSCRGRGLGRWRCKQK
jgi:ATP-dependent RNA helicase DBP3